MEHQSLVSPGSGVKRVRTEEKDDTQERPEKQPGEPGSDVMIDKEAGWVNEPSYNDQLTRYRNTCRVGSPKIETYDLSDKDQKDALNELLKRTEPKTAPQVIVDTTERQFHKGVYYVLASFREVKYLKLISKPSAS